MKKNKKTRIHSFNSKGDKAYYFAMRAPKSPSEALEENLAPGFLIVMPEESTLEDLHKYITSKLLDRNIKDFYFRFGHPDDTQEEMTEEEKEKAIENVKYYVSDDLLSENPEYHDAHIQLRIMHVKEHTHFGYRLKVGGAEWQNIGLLKISPLEPDQECPGSVRVVARMVSPNGDNEQTKKIKEALNKSQSDGISDLEEEKYVQQMHKTMSSYYPLSFKAMLFMFSSIGVMEYVRLHKLINFVDEQSRNDWMGTFVYTSSIINEKDPLFLDNKIEIDKIAKHFKTTTDTILKLHEVAKNCLKEENIDVSTMAMSNIVKNDMLKDHFKPFEEAFEKKSHKVYQFKKK